MANPNFGLVQILVSEVLGKKEIKIIKQWQKDGYVRKLRKGGRMKSNGDRGIIWIYMRGFTGV